MSHPAGLSLFWFLISPKQPLKYQQVPEMLCYVFPSKPSPTQRLWRDKSQKEHFHLFTAALPTTEEAFCQTHNILWPTVAEETVKPFCATVLSVTQCNYSGIRSKLEWGEVIRLKKKKREQRNHRGRHPAVPTPSSEWHSVGDSHTRAGDFPLSEEVK